MSADAKLVERCKALIRENEELQMECRRLRYTVAEWSSGRTFGAGWKAAINAALAYTDPLRSQVTVEVLHKLLGGPDLGATSGAAEETER